METYSKIDGAEEQNLDFLGLYLMRPKGMVMRDGLFLIKMKMNVFRRDLLTWPEAFQLKCEAEEGQSQALAAKFNASKKILATEI